MHIDFKNKIKNINSSHFVYNHIHYFIIIIRCEVIPYCFINSYTIRKYN